MTKSANGIFEYEKQWQIFKGNEYMSNILSRMKPKVSSQCPRSYLDFQKMPKNHLSSLTKEHERLLQNSILQKKLDNISKRQVPKMYFLTDKYRAQNIMKHKKSYRQTVEENNRYLENKHLFQRIGESKSFFSKGKIFYPICQKKAKFGKSASMTCLNFKPSTSVSLFDKSENSEQKSPTELPVFNYLDTFNYLDLNEELIDSNKKFLQIYNKKHYINNFGLVYIKIIYLYSRLIIAIEPFSSFGNNTFLIIVNGDNNLSAFNKAFDKIPSIIKSLYFDTENFMFKKNIPKLSYITHTLLREKFHLMEIDQDYTFY